MGWSETQGRISQCWNIGKRGLCEWRGERESKGKFRSLGAVIIEASTDRGAGGSLGFYCIALGYDSVRHVNSRVCEIAHRDKIYLNVNAALVWLWTPYPMGTALATATNSTTLPHTTRQPQHYRHKTFEFRTLPSSTSILRVEWCVNDVHVHCFQGLHGFTILPNTHAVIYQQKRYRGTMILSKCQT